LDFRRVCLVSEIAQLKVQAVEVAVRRTGHPGVLRWRAGRRQAGRL